MYVFIYGLVYSEYIDATINTFGFTKKSKNDAVSIYLNVGLTPNYGIEDANEDDRRKRITNTIWSPSFNVNNGFVLYVFVWFCSRPSR